MSTPTPPAPENRSGTYDTARSSKARASFPLPDVEWAPTRPFWEAAARHELRVPFCVACGAPNWYPHEQCDTCGEQDFDWRLLSGRGGLYSYSVVRHVFLPQYASLVPFVSGLVSLEEAPSARVVAMIVDCEPDALRCDLPVEVVFRPLRFAGVDGEVTAPMFRPSSPGQG